MYKLTGKVSNHGDHAVLGVMAEFGRGKKQEVFLVSKMEYPKPCATNLMNSDISTHRFFASHTLAITAANEASRDGKLVKDLPGNRKGKTYPDMVRFLQNS